MSIPLIGCGASEANGIYGNPPTGDPDCLAANFGIATDDNTFLSRSLGPIGVIDGKLLTFSVTIKPEVSQARFMHLSAPCICHSTGYIEFGFHNVSAAYAVKFRSDTGLISIGTDVWYTLVVSFDLSDTGKRHVYLNGTDIGAGGTWLDYTNENMDLTHYWAIGGQNPEWGGCMGEVWIDDSYMDLSVLANREKFYDEGLVYPGATGNGPTGVAPLVWLPMDYTAPGVNGGTGGNFTENGVAWAACNSVPQRSGTVQPPDPPPPSGVRVWHDPFRDEYAIPLFVRNPPTKDYVMFSIPQPQRVRVGATAGEHSYVAPSSNGEFAFWCDQFNDNTYANHHTTLEINSGAPYALAPFGTFGRAYPFNYIGTSDMIDYYITMEVLFNNVGDDPNWSIAFQEKGGTGANPFLALQLEDGVLDLIVRGDDTDTSPTFPNRVTNTVAIVPSVTYNQWYQIEMWIGHDPNSGGNGYIICDVDEIEKMNMSGIQIGWKYGNAGTPDNPGCNSSFGMYQYMGPDGNDENETQLRTIEIWDLTDVA